MQTPKQLRKRCPLTLEAIKTILENGFDKYGEDDYDLQEAISTIPAHFAIYSDLSLKFVKLSKGMGRMFDLQIRDTSSLQKLGENDRKWFLKVAHDTLDCGAFMVLLLSEVSRVLDIDPRELVNNAFSERYEQPKHLSAKRKTSQQLARYYLKKTRFINEFATPSEVTNVPDKPTIKEATVGE